MSVICPYCGKEFKGDKLNSRHLSKCNPALKVPVEPCLCGHVSTSLTQMKRHRKKCEVWQNRDKKQVALQRQEKTVKDKYGVRNIRQVPELEEKRLQTIRGKYGADNVFCKESSIFEKVQESLVGKRKGLKGKDNPFAWDSTKEKIKKTMQESYGVDSPQQSQEIRDRTKSTNLERYGFECLLSDPVIRDRIKETCKVKYGGPAPSCSSEVRDKQTKTNLKCWGVPWTAMHPDIRQKQLETMKEHYGSHFFASEEGKAEIRRVMMERYGVEFPGAMVGHWEKALATFKKNYPNTAYPGLLAGRGGPNMLERRIHQLIPDAIYTGDGSFWRWLPLLGHFKNPDFIFPGPDPNHPMRNVTKVVEAFGSYWHSRIFTGKSNFKHEQELIDSYAGIGFDCLIIWEDDVKSDIESVRTRLVEFVGV